MSERALSDLRVLDLSTGVAGPFCTKLLADYGADVIKVEPLNGDEARRKGPFYQDVPDQEHSTLFLFLNSNKRSVTLDASTKLGQRILCDLVTEWANVLVETFPPGQMSDWGLGYEHLERLNPGLVYTSVTPFGQTGPYRDYRAEEIVSFAMSGLMHVTGEPDREPVKYFGEQAGYQAGSMAAVATMGAYWYAVMSGTGQHVDVSIMEAALALVELNLLPWSYSGEPGNLRRGNRGQGFPRTVYPCLDGHVAVGGQQAEWGRICQVLGMPELANDPNFATVAARTANRDELEAYVLPWMYEHTMAEIFDRAQHLRVGWGPVYTIEDLVNDPHAQAREFLVQAHHPVVGKHLYPGAPFKLTKSPWELRQSAPQLGQHNAEVYGDLLGFSSENLSKMRTWGVI